MYKTGVKGEKGAPGALEINGKKYFANREYRRKFAKEQKRQAKKDLFKKN